MNYTSSIANLFLLALLSLELRLYSVNYLYFILMLLLTRIKFPHYGTGLSFRNVAIAKQLFGECSVGIPSHSKMLQIKMGSSGSVAGLTSSFLSSWFCSQIFSSATKVNSFSLSQKDLSKVVWVILLGILFDLLLTLLLLSI